MDFVEATSHAAKALVFMAKSISTLYRLVVAMLTWPSQLRMTLTSTPDCNRCIAVVWRNVCGVTLYTFKPGMVAAALVVYRWIMSAMPERLRGRPWRLTKR